MKFVLACVLVLASVGAVADTPPRMVSLDVWYEDTFKSYAEQRGEDPEALALKVYWSRIVLPYWDAFRIFVAVRDVRYAQVNAADSSGSSHLSAFRDYLWYTEGYIANPERAPGLSTMFTNRLYADNVRGVAYLGTVCNPKYSYSVSSMRDTSMYGPPTVPHELGHNMGADHDQAPGNIMFAAVYTGSLYNGFSQSSIDAIDAELAPLPTVFQTDCVVNF